MIENDLNADGSFDSLWTWTWLADERMIRETQPNGYWIDYHYDCDDRLIE